MHLGRHAHSGHAVQVEMPYDRPQSWLLIFLTNSVQVVLQWLAEQPAVHWVAPRAAVKLHNWQGTAIVQSASAAPFPPLLLTQDRGTHPVWAAGLTGAGQIIGGGDSGIGAHSDGLLISGSTQFICS